MAEVDVRTIQFCLLGPVDVRVDGRSVAVGGSHSQAVLAALLLEANHVVPIDRLVEAGWGEDPPDWARVQAQNRVSKLRRVLRDAGGGDVIHTHGTGYLIRIDDAHLDVGRFHDWVHQAGERASRGDLSGGVAFLTRALSLWHGPALHGLTTPRMATAARRLDDSRIHAQELRIDLDLRRGRHDQVIGDLVELVAAHPWRERPVGHLMVALYRANRQQEALACYDELRLRLAEELGVDPGKELVRLRDLILRGSPELDLERPRPAGPAVKLPTATASLLPRTASDFVGRAAELAMLDSIATGTQTGSSVTIVAIIGPGGVGKTALATYWARRMSGRYPGGQLYVDLRGYGPGPPVRPLEALGLFLRAMGIPAEDVPPDEEAAAGSYRSVLAGRRVLVVLDNAASPDQVRPLLPAGSASLVLVTSRDRLTGLRARDGARRLPLRALDQNDAVELLRRMLGPPRVAAEHAITAELAAACGYLPLALRIAGAQLEDDPSRPIADYLATLRVPGRLSGLQIAGDSQSAVRRPFDESYGGLTEPAATLFRLLSLVPGPSFGAEVGAALLDTELEQATGLLDRLASVHLIDRRSADRYALHDLLRDYAGERLRAFDTPQAAADARDRLYRFYLSRAGAAADEHFSGALRLPGSTVAAAEFESRTAARSWLDTERANLVAAAAASAADGPAEFAWLLADALRSYFWLKPDSVDWVTLATAGLAAATAAGDRLAMAAIEYSLGMSHLRANRHHESVAHLRLAITLGREAGWPDCEAAALGSLAIAHTEFGQIDTAAEQFRQAIALNERLGRTGGLANSLGNLGLLELRMGQFRSAATHLDRALALHRESGNLSTRAVHLHGLGRASGYLGEYAAAFDLLADALAMSRELGATDNQAEVLGDLALLHAELGHGKEALEHARAAVALARSTQERSVEVHALLGLAAGLSCVGEHDDAVAGSAAALELAKGQTGYLELAALVQLATAEQRAGNWTGAEAHARQAVSAAESGGFRHFEGVALEVLAEAGHGRGERAGRPAVRNAELAIGIHRETGYRLGHTRAEALLATMSRGAREPG